MEVLVENLYAVDGIIARRYNKRRRIIYFINTIFFYLLQLKRCLLAFWTITKHILNFFKFIKLLFLHIQVKTNERIKRNFM